MSTEVLGQVAAAWLSPCRQNGDWSSMVEESGFVARRQERNNAGLRVGAVLTATLVPLFTVLDRFILLDHWWDALTMRLIVTGYALICLPLTYTRFGPRWSSALSVSLFTGAGLIITAMIFLDQGYRSSYYAGLMLVVFATGVLFHWTLRECLLCYATIYASYCLPGSLQYLELGQELRTLLGNNFFVASAIVIACVAHRHAVQMLKRECSANLELLATKASLEEVCGDLKERDRLKSKFFNNVTHELRTPLTMILAPLERLIEEGPAISEETRSEYLRSIQANARRLLKLINDLLDLSRIDEHFLHLAPEETSLGPLLHEIVEYAQPLAVRKGIALQLEHDESVGSLCADIEKIERVIVNLLANALKFTEPGGTVSVWTRETSEELMVGVRDTGRGIPKDAQRWIFERFRQADDHVARSYGGTGIGLALAREIVQLHGGQITLESVEGDGSNFVVHLPRAGDPLARGARDLRTKSASVSGLHSSEVRESREWVRQLTGQKSFRFLDLDAATELRSAPRGKNVQRHATKIAVVEDNVEILRFISLQLQDEHDVFLATDGETGFDLVRLERPDVVVTDYMMPKVDGPTLIKRLRSDPTTATVPVIMLTARNQIAERLVARESGANIYLSKPFSPQELRSAIAQLLRSRGQQVDVVVREQVRSLEVISAGFAHEIHNPLSYLSNALYVIGERLEVFRTEANRDGTSLAELRGIIESGYEKVNRMLTIARTGIVRIEQVVELVRRYTRAGSPRAPIPTSLDATVQEVTRLVIPPDGRVVNLDCQLTTEGVQINCVPGELQQVLRNLLQNAFEAVRDGGHVWVRTETENQWAVCEVRDDGLGIPPDVLSRIFTPFFTTKAPGRGMGLGLAISHQLVRQTGGEIAVESVVDRGTTFRVRLPIFRHRQSVCGDS